jgi:hypothetical protein
MRELPSVSHEAGAIARLSRLLADGAVDAVALDARAAEVEQLLSAGADPGLTRNELLILGVNLHAYYTALETLFERVARLLDDELPAGPNWHRDLLLQMRITLPSIRPAVLDEAVIDDLDELRKFRHFFRNAYVLELDPKRTVDHGTRLVRSHAQVALGINNLFRHVQEVRSELTK